jgi:hypothetical protein
LDEQVQNIFIDTFMEKETLYPGLIIPYGGKLIKLLVSGEERNQLIRRANNLPSIQLSARSIFSRPRAEEQKNGLPKETEEQKTFAQKGERD